MIANEYSRISNCYYRLLLILHTQRFTLHRHTLTCVVRMKLTYWKHACISTLGDQFVFYDFNNPLSVPEDHHGTYDFVLADPPYLNVDCMTKTGQTMRLLARSDDTPMLLNTGWFVGFFFFFFFSFFFFLFFSLVSLLLFLNNGTSLFCNAVPAPFFWHPYVLRCRAWRRHWKGSWHERVCLQAGSLVQAW